MEYVCFTKKRTVLHAPPPGTSVAMVKQEELEDVSFQKPQHVQASLRSERNSFIKKQERH